jgi:nucleoside-diphosphate-sugar epimerase
LPSIQSPLGALPSRFRRERVLVIGCGDVGLRVVRALGKRVVIRALTSSPDRAPLLRQSGVTPLYGNLDAPRSLARLAALGTRVLHLAPPAREHAGAWWRDFRTQALLRALSLRTPARSLVYASTTGVYGDCKGELVPESRVVQPRTPRAQRRVDAERLVRHFGRAMRVRASLLRIPGIYASDRPGGARERLLQGSPVLDSKDDVFTNHIHADDLARVVAAAMWRGARQRVYNASDDTQLKIGDYYDLAARIFGQPPPPRVSRSRAEQELPLGLLSFIDESRRVVNTRMKRELRVRLRYPTVAEGLK